MARLTRSESQLRNREQVRAAARRLFLAQGYAATSLAAVAEEAGFSTGVVYSNFSGKAELALQVLREIQAEQFETLRGAMEGRPLAEALDGLQAWADAALDSGWPRFEVEFALEAGANPALVAEEAERHRAAVAAIGGTVESLVPGDHTALVPVDVAVEAVLNLAYGVAIRRLVDPSVTAERMIKPLRELLASFGYAA